MGETFPLWGKIVLLVVFGGFTYGAAVLHNRRVALRGVERGICVLPGPGNWLDRMEVEIEIEESTLFRRRLKDERLSQIAREIRDCEDFPDGERRILEAKISERHRREQVTTMRLDYIKECPEGYDPDQDLYHEDTLQKWLLQPMETEQESDFDPFAFLEPGDLE